MSAKDTPAPRPPSVAPSRSKSPAAATGGAACWLAGPGYLVAVGYMDPQLGHRRRRRRSWATCCSR